MLAGAIILFPKDTKAAECSASTTCGNACSYGGVTYNTVLIGTQCWFKKNLNAGEMIGNFETPDDTAPTLNDPNTFSKWCYDNSLAYCTSEGGLYTWAEANALPDSCNLTSCSIPTLNQGICPNGWHIPTDEEFYILENYLKTPGQTCDAARLGWGCADAGTKLKLGGSSGFDAIGAGNHETNGEDSFFDKREPAIHFLSSSEQLLPHIVPSYMWNRGMGSGNDMIYRSNYQKAFGYSVRCLADTTNIEVDEDGDGVLNTDDQCPETVADDPSIRLGVNRWMWDGDSWETTASKGKKPSKNFNMDYTYGCSCDQILSRMTETHGEGLGGHYKYGCSRSILEDWHMAPRTFTSFNAFCQ